MERSDRVIEPLMKMSAELADVKASVMYLTRLVRESQFLLAEETPIASSFMLGPTINIPAKTLPSVQ